MKSIETSVRPAAGKKRNAFMVEMKRNYPYYLMMVPAALIMFVFSYLPMPGMIVAFQDFNFVDKFKSPFVGWDNFKFFFTSSYAYRTTFNTIFINLNYLVWTTFVSVLFAILLNEIRSKLATKFYQNMMFLPYFFSAVVVGKLVTDIVFSDQNGIANQIIHLFGHEPIVWSQVSGPWGWIIIGTHIWKTAGYSSIIYLASIAGIDDHLYEAASLDGATRWQQIRTITLPMLTPVIIIMTLLSIGGMLRGDFDTIYSIVGDNGLLFAHTDVIDTYIFRAIKQAADFGPTAAVGLYQSVVGFILVFGSNALVKRYNKDSALF
ncbi:ABC transporter permease [Paenibacillus sacheonensis]|uniref:ABC transporter permease subunit n=1 Tax=Paenibacillus sacheonensis TaxID=742054 RepID=A0A7X5C0P5_9BACL|nr:ABC transporter permease subunit [Paenibacillus sacheonensis]MBM7567772.1 putative aldouronate transport system permease protein [Paenibacillus sacheonensis]NBC71957.1 ABC transporter permease subunit [Paenibacillus sacheonensis]